MSSSSTAPALRSAVTRRSLAASVRGPVAGEQQPATVAAARDTARQVHWPLPAPVA